ncbi:YraN family protein [Oceanicoccus sagamiensis]|uniref:UPF0102 protein BST96_12590 n=1 Tax=Oceanicoccus sagamiensis TaxID=716816 RepID=A0A1X9NH92_9GAMM|nr:YraN family protein [Oceanicoccus sagamiensis]ARN74879.1 YraN family protein [Oceanicoccus sagamiensis]
MIGTRITKASDTGAAAEQKARQWLQQQGLSYIASNYRCKAGEIDIIMRDGQQLVFVEVRYRKQGSFGDGLESVTWRKQQKLLKAAACYLQEKKRLNSMPCRFDVVAAKPGCHDQLHWTWVKDAFTN